MIFYSCYNIQSAIKRLSKHHPPSALPASPIKFCLFERSVKSTHHHCSKPSTQLIIHHNLLLSDRLLSNMFKFASALAIVVATIPSTSAFFSTKITTPVKRQVSSFILSYQNEPGMQSPVTFQPPDAAFDIAGTYERAIDCANNYGLCAIDELIDLSEGTNIVV